MEKLKGICTCINSSEEAEKLLSNHIISILCDWKGHDLSWVNFDENCVFLEIITNSSHIGIYVDFNSKSDSEYINDWRSYFSVVLSPLDFLKVVEEENFSKYRIADAHKIMCDYV